MRNRQPLWVSTHYDSGEHMTFGFWINNLPVEKTGMTVWEWFLSLFSRPKPAPQPVPSPIPEPIVILFDALNDVRREFALPPFLSLGKADMIAQLRADGMRSRRTLSHEWFEQQVAAKFPANATAENIEQGSATAREVVANWMNEPFDKDGRRKHRENILGDYRYVGCGHAADFWCADFVGPP